MLANEIEQLKSRISEIKLENQDKEDEMLAAMSYQPGWEVLKLRVDKRINDLLEPGAKSEDLAFLGAVTMARELAIEVLRAVVSDVESAKTTKKNIVSDGAPE